MKRMSLLPLLALLLALPGLRAADDSTSLAVVAASRQSAANLATNDQRRSTETPLRAAAAPPQGFTPFTDPRTGFAIFLRNEAVQSPTPLPHAAAPATPPVVNTADLTSPPWTNALAVAWEFLAQHAWAFGEAEPGRHLQAWRAERDALGMTHVRFRQLVPVTLGAATNGAAAGFNPGEPAGLPVVGGEIIVHLTPDQQVSSAGGRLAPALQMTTPAVPPEAAATGLTKATAIALAQSLFAAENGVEGVADATVSRAIVVPGLLENTTDASAYLTWAVGVANDPRFSAVYYVDAQEGSLRLKGERVRQLYRKIYDCTANPSSGACWSSLVDSNGYHHGRREGEASWGPHPVYNAYDVDTAYDVLGSAHEYLASRFGRNGANGQGGMENGGCNNPVTVTSANTYQDQFWGAGCTRASFSSTCATIAFCHALTTPDVIAHEYAHGVTFSVRDMTYYGQTGALDESYSDVFGQIFEKSYLGATDWIDGAGTGASGRNLREPALSLERSDPDRFYSPLVQCGTEDSGGVHDNSTILSHAAYLLAEGTGTNGPFNGCTIQAIGIEQMEQVMYRANVFYYSASESFNGAYLDWIQASTDLYGATSETTRQVTRALQAVELDQPGLCSGIPAHPPAATDVPPGPLTVTPAGPDLVLSWPPVPWLAGEPVLLATTNLTAGPWTALTAPLTTNVVTVPTTGTAHYFRLRIP